MQSPQRMAAPPTAVTYLGLGSNLGDRAYLIDAAVARLVARGVLRDVCLSALYETDAVAANPQPPYLNAVVRGETPLPPETLLARCLEVESELGRVRPAGQSKAARTIDIDVLLYGAAVIDIDAPRLTVPHPAMLERAFVLVPLRDVAQPGLSHPITGMALDSEARPSSASSTRDGPPRLYRPPTRG